MLARIQTQPCLVTAALAIALAVLPFDLHAREATHELPMPRVPPCEAATFLVSNLSDPSLEGLWRFGAREVSVGRTGREPASIDSLAWTTGRLELRWPDRIADDQVWLWLRAQCGDGTEGPSITWSCDAANCDLAVSYQEPATSLPEPALPDVPEECLSFADGKAPPRSCHKALGRLLQAELADAAASADLACRGGRCSKQVSDGAAHLRKLASAKRWRTVGRLRDVKVLPGNVAPANALDFKTEKSTVSLVCSREADVEGHPLVCGVELRHQKRRLAFSRHRIHNTGSLTVGDGRVELGDGILSLDQPSLALAGAAE